MSAPTPYNRYTNFVSYSINNPTVPYNPADHDAEFNAVELTLDQTVALLNGITRSDGLLKNGIVTIDTVAASLLLALTSVNGGWVIKGEWQTATAYGVGNVVTSGGNTYVSTTVHTSAVAFATDSASGFWAALFSPPVLNGAGLLPVVSGGTEANLSSTGGAGRYLKQSTLGGAVTVGTIPSADVVGAPVLYEATVGFGATPRAAITIGVANATAVVASKIVASVVGKVGDTLQDELEMDNYEIAGRCLVNGTIIFNVAHVSGGLSAGDYVINYILG